MEEPRMSDYPTGGSVIEIITDEARVKEAEPLISVKTGLTGGKTFIIKINEPAGRALLIAVHL
jgi:hypothetical protein